MGDWIHKHRNLLLLALLLVTLAVSCVSNQHRLQEAGTTVSLPIVQTVAAPSSRLEQFRESRDASALEDMAALETLCGQEIIDEQTRKDAAAQLQRLVDVRQKQTALEGALTQSGLYPCVAIVTDGSVTIVTDKTELSSGESALLLTMAKTHAGVDPSGVRVVTADNTP